MWISYNSKRNKTHKSPTEKVAPRGKKWRSKIIVFMRRHFRGDGLFGWGKNKANTHPVAEVESLLCFCNLAKQFIRDVFEVRVFRYSGRWLFKSPRNPRVISAIIKFHYDFIWIIQNYFKICMHIYDSIYRWNIVSMFIVRIDRHYKTLVFQPLFITKCR